MSDEPYPDKTSIAYTCHICGPGSLCHCDDDEDAAYEDEERDCSRCSGDGWQECPDPIQCTYPHNKYGECPCHACGGSGDAKDQTVW